MVKYPAPSFLKPMLAALSTSPSASMQSPTKADDLTLLRKGKGKVSLAAFGSLTQLVYCPLEAIFSLRQHVGVSLR